MTPEQRNLRGRMAATAGHSRHDPRRPATTRDDDHGAADLSRPERETVAKHRPGAGLGLMTHARFVSVTQGQLVQLDGAATVLLVDRIGARLTGDPAHVRHTGPVICRVALR